MFFDGEWVEARAIPNPATGAIVAAVPNAGVEDLERAIVAARHAFDEGPWRRTRPVKLGGSGQSGTSEIDGYIDFGRLSRLSAERHDC